MNAEFEKYHLIDRFLRNELSPEEQAAFENRLLIDSGFAEDVEFQKDVNEVITAASLHKLREKMSRDIEARENTVRFRNWLGGILVFLIAGFAGYFILNTYKEVTETAIQKEERKTETPEKDLLATAAPAGKDTEEPTESTLNTKSGIMTESKTPVPVVALPHTEKNEEAAEPNDTVTARKAVQNEQITFNRKSSTAEAGTVKSSKTLPDKEDQEEDVDTESKGVAENICEGVKITSSWDVETACLNQNNGAIQVDESSFGGGTEPYQVELSKGKVKVTDQYFASLYSGTYTLKVTDAKGCTCNWDIFVAEKPCREKEVSISPAHGETWEFNGDEGESYYLSILNQSGQMVYKSFLTGTTKWDGTGNMGIPVETGLYIYIIEYTNGKKLKGQITVIK